MTLWGSVGQIIHVLEEIVKRQFVIFLLEPYHAGKYGPNKKIFVVRSVGLGGTGRLRGADVDGDAAGGGPASSCSFRRGAGPRLLSSLLCDLRLSSRSSRGLDCKPRTWQLSATAEGKQLFRNSNCQLILF